MKHFSHSGFTLLEVLIAMVILAIGLLGLAGLQGNSMRFNNSAYFRSQASFLASDISDKMRANQAAITAGSFDAIDTAANDYAIGTCFNDSASTTCTSSAIATSVIGQWESLLQSVLPSGEGTITKGVGGQYSVTITWIDNTADASDKTKTFTTVFKP